MASARRAADLHGKKVGIIERGPLGGTCVNVGCVPKKIMWTAAELGKSMSLARDYGYNKNVDATAAPNNIPSPRRAPCAVLRAPCLGLSRVSALSSVRR